MSHVHNHRVQRQSPETPMPLPHGFKKMDRKVDRIIESIQRLQQELIQHIGEINRMQEAEQKEHAVEHSDSPKSQKSKAPAHWDIHWRWQPGMSYAQLFKERQEYEQEQRKVDREVRICIERKVKKNRAKWRSAKSLMGSISELGSPRSSASQSSSPHSEETSKSKSFAKEHQVPSPKNSRITRSMPHSSARDAHVPHHGSTSMPRSHPPVRAQKKSPRSPHNKFEKHKTHYLAARTLWEAARGLHSKGEHGESLFLCERSMDIYKSLNDEQGKSLVTWLIADFENKTMND